MGRLTDSQLQAWVRKGEPVRGKSDGAGLTFSISKAGTATWELRYRHGGRQKWLTLGGYPALSLRDARAKAVRERVRILDGADPVADRRRVKAAAQVAQTFREVAEHYLEKHGPRLSESFVKGFRRYLSKYINPVIGRMRLEEITGAEIVTIIERVSRKSPTGAAAAFSRMSVVFDHAVARHMLKANPCRGLKPSAIVGAAKPARERLQLTCTELRALFDTSETLSPVYPLVIKIMLATAVRRGEMVKARVDAVDLESALWTIPIEDSKSRRAFVIPLAPRVTEWFRELIALGQGSPWVVPGQDRQRHMIPETVNATFSALRAKLGDRCRPLTPHDLRSTARSYLSELGVDIATAERCLNHSLGGLVEIYDQSDRIDQRRRALELWAEFLGAIEDGKDWRVTPINRSAAA